jgi:hypothetical protein
MKRFLLVLALVAVAGATYIATAPGGQAAGPTASEFRALKTEVGGLKLQLRKVKKLLHDCMAISGPITRRGDWSTPAGPTFGYSYSDPSINSGTAFPETALDVTTPDDPNALWITAGGSKCGADIGGARRNVAPLFRSHGN